MTIAQTLENARQALRAAENKSPDLDAEVLLAQLLSVDRAYLFANPDRVLDEKKLHEYQRLVQRRSLHEPIAYLVGHKEFFGIDFITTEAALIPRPETELLVEAALSYIRGNPACRSLLDVGTGCGALAIALAQNAQQLDIIYAVDVSRRALDVARMNVQKYALSHRIHFKRSNVLLMVKDRFDVIVANLPYLSQKEYARAKKDCMELSFEPQIALLGGTTGLLFFERLFQKAQSRMRPHGAIFLEIGEDQAEYISALAHRHLKGEWRITVTKDLAGKDRILSLFSPS